MLRRSYRAAALAAFAALFAVAPLGIADTCVEGDAFACRGGGGGDGEVPPCAFSGGEGAEEEGVEACEAQPRADPDASPSHLGLIQRRWRRLDSGAGAEEPGAIGAGASSAPAAKGSAAAAAHVLVALEDGARDAEVPPANNDLVVHHLDVTSYGESGGRLASLKIANDEGGFELGGHEYAAFAYVGQNNFGSFDLFDVFAVREDGLGAAVIYGYCRGGSLDYIYSEGFGADGLLPMKWEKARGPCEIRDSLRTVVHVDLPPLKVLPKFQQMGIFAVSERLKLGSQSGWVIAPDPLGGAQPSRQDVLPFGKVNCTTCPGGPWYEVHAILSIPDISACFGILYFFPASDEVRLDYSICTPSLKSVDTSFKGVHWGFGESADDDGAKAPTAQTQLAAATDAVGAWSRPPEGWPAPRAPAAARSATLAAPTAPSSAS